VLIFCALTFFFLYFDLHILSIVTGAVGVFVLFFFRDPERKGFGDAKAVLTPADGTVVQIQNVNEEESPLGEPAVKLGVFMSIFNVHVNRIPMEGTIEKITYCPGKFFSANLDKASKYNENNRVTLQIADLRRIVIVQIAGIIARRISCWVKENDHVQAAQRFGLIRFGSRLEVYLPADSRVVAGIGQKVRAGESVLAYLS